jgi:hypothetical protein
MPTTYVTRPQKISEYQIALTVELDTVKRCVAIFKHRTLCFTRKNTRYPLVEEWVSSRVGLNIVEKRNISFCLCRKSKHGHPAKRQSLHAVICPNPHPNQNFCFKIASFIIYSLWRLIYYCCCYFSTRNNAELLRYQHNNN